MDNCRIRRINCAMRETFRLATFNCEHLDWSASKADVFALRCAALRPVLDALDADILCLQEIDAQKRHKHGPRDYLALDYLLEGGRYAGFHRAATRRPETGAPADVHNLVILSRWPIIATRQIHHDYAPRWEWSPPPEEDQQPSALSISWDRPLLYAAIAAQGGLLHVINLHLRAPRPAPVVTARGKGSSRSRIEGQFVAALKRDGQALEARLFVETLFDADPAARIAVSGDFNADVYETPTRLLRGGADADTDEPRALVALETRIAPERRHTVIHAGRHVLLDHILASSALAADWRETQILNDGLADEALTEGPVEGSLHAPVVVSFVASDG
jgi:endonuclease/exonuclease/phosphatase family metal-dependent hydrolase